VSTSLRSFPQGPAPKPAARLTSGAATGGDGECWVGISLSPHRAPQGRGARPRTATASCSAAAASVVARSHGGVRSEMLRISRSETAHRPRLAMLPCSAPVRAIPSRHAHDRRSAAPGRGPQRRAAGPRRPRTRPGGLGADLRRQPIPGQGAPFEGNVALICRCKRRALPLRHTPMNCCLRRPTLVIGVSQRPV
jgi:hypothetical protein